jgi:predicted Zn-ribbon and HTH transcriptional regulator
MPENDVAGKPIGMVPLQVTGCRCRCGHEWLPQGGERPRVCPKCKSPNWDRPKRWTRKDADAKT